MHVFRNRHCVVVPFSFLRRARGGKGGFTYSRTHLFNFVVWSIITAMRRRSLHL